MNADAIMKLSAEAASALEQAADLKELEALRVRYIGRKGLVQDVMQSLKEATPEDRPGIGKAANQFKQQFQQAFDSRKAALEAGAADVSTEGDTIEVTCDPDDFEAVLNAMKEAGFEHENAEILKVPEARVSLDHDRTRKSLRLIELLEDNDDVQEVSSNLDIPDDFDPDE